jgi:hypothetical protein
MGEWDHHGLCYDARPSPRVNSPRRTGFQMKETISRAISTLNSLGVGDLDRIHLRLGEVESDLAGLGAQELVEMLTDARGALDGGDVPLFRRRVQHVVSRLGHLR